MNAASPTPLLNKLRLVEIMRAERVEAVVATSSENVTYSSGYWALSQWIRRGPQIYVLLPASDLNASEIIASTTLLDQIADQEDVWIRNVRRYGYFQVDRSNAPLDALDQRQAELYALADDGNALDALVRAITSAGLSRSRIAIDEMGLLPGHWERLAGALPNATLVPAFQLLRKVRAVKTPEEIARLGRVARITEDSIDAALKVASEGVTESELARPFHSCTVMNDAFPVIGCIGFGTRAAMPNVQPSATPLKRGDVIRFDVGGRYRHYRADVARIAVLGEADRKTSSYCRALHVGVLKALEMIRPGVRASDVFATAVEAVRREGISHYNRSHVGHGIGLDGYDLPDLTAASQDIIEEGMVMCVETPYYELGWTGLQVEDMIVVRRDGVENLMGSFGGLRIVP
jgi:Xaa-Pro dipeptidase